MYTVFSFNHSLYGNFDFKSSSICFSLKISPVKVLIASMPPGDTLPFFVIFLFSVTLTPVSDAIVIILSLSI